MRKVPCAAPEKNLARLGDLRSAVSAVQSGEGKGNKANANSNNLNYIPNLADRSTTAEDSTSDGLLTQFDSLGKDVPGIIDNALPGIDDAGPGGDAPDAGVKRRKVGDLLLRRNEQNVAVNFDYCV